MNTTNTNTKPLDLGTIIIGHCYECKEKILLGDLGVHAYEREDAGYVCSYCAKNGAQLSLSLYGDR